MSNDSNGVYCSQKGADIVNVDKSMFGTVQGGAQFVI